MTIQKPKALFDFRVNELSLVKKGANRKPKFLIKSEDSELSKLDLIEKLDKLSPAQNKAIEDKLNIIRKNHNLSEEAETALKASLALLEITKSEIPNGTVIGVNADDIVFGVEKADRTTQATRSLYGMKEKGEESDDEESDDEGAEEEAEDEEMKSEEKKDKVKKLGYQKYPAGKPYPPKEGDPDMDSDDETGEDAEDETNELGGTYEKKAKKAEEEESDVETGETAEDETRELGGTYSKKKKAENPNKPVGELDAHEHYDSMQKAASKKSASTGAKLESESTHAEEYADGEGEGTEEDYTKKKKMAKEAYNKPVGEKNTTSQVDRQGQMAESEQGSSYSKDNNWDKRVNKMGTKDTEDVTTVPGQLAKKSGGKSDMEDLTEQNASDISRTVKSEEVEKALADLNALHIQEIDEIKKSYETKIQKAMDFVDEKNKENFSRVIKGEFPVFEEISKEAQTLIQKQAQEIEILKADLIRRQEREAELIAINKAEKEFSALGSAPDLGRLIRKAQSQLDNSTYEQFEDVLKFAQGQIDALGDITRELGTKGVGEFADNEQKVQKMAEDLIKDDPSLTIEKARIQVRNKNPELYK